MSAEQKDFGFYTEDDNIGEQIQKVVTASKASERDKVLIWIHGGLVDRRGGEAGIPSISQQALADGWHPVLPIWESGLGTSLRDVWLQFVIRKAVKGAIEVLVPFLRAKINLLPVKSFGAAQGDEQSATDLLLLNELVLRNQDLMDEEALLSPTLLGAAPVEPTHIPALSDPQEQSRLSKNLQSSALSAPAPGTEVKGFNASLAIAKWVFKVSIDVLRRWAVQESNITENAENVSKRPLETLIMDSIARDLEIGGMVWSEIKKDAARICGANGAIQKLLSAVYDQMPDAEVMLVGHSTGGVLINEILRSEVIKGKKLHIRLVASAATCTATGKAFSETEAKIITVRNITLTEEREAQSKLLQEQELLDKVPGLREMYTGSLLYAVSAAFEEQDKETPLAGMVRFARVPNWITLEEKEAILSYSKFLNLGGLTSPTPANAKYPNSISGTRHGDLSGKFLDATGKLQDDPEGIRSIISLTDK